MSELKPCPFCGGDNLEVDKTERDVWFVICLTCGAYMAKYYKPEAIEAWNTRHERTCEVACNERGCPECGECGCLLYSTSGYCPDCGVRLKEETDADN